jgi:hypothetical protein
MDMLGRGNMNEIMAGLGGFGGFGRNMNRMGGNQGMLSDMRYRGGNQNSNNSNMVSDMRYRGNDDMTHALPPNYRPREPSYGGPDIASLFQQMG